MTLMGHKDLKTTMRYIRAVQLQRNVRCQNFGHKSPTQAERPPTPRLGQPGRGMRCGRAQGLRFRSGHWFVVVRSRGCFLAVT